MAVVYGHRRTASKIPGTEVFSSQGTPFSRHFTGVIGELAAIRVYGGEFDTGVSPGGDDNSYDFIGTDGQPINAKATGVKGPGARLMVYDGRLSDDMMYVLVQVTAWPDCCEVYPRVPGWHLRQAHPVSDFGYGPTHWIRAGEILASL